MFWMGGLINKENRSLQVNLIKICHLCLKNGRNIVRGFVIITPVKSHSKYLYSSCKAEVCPRLEDMYFLASFFVSKRTKKKLFELIFFEIFLNQCRCVEDRENVGRAKKPQSFTIRGNFLHIHHQKTVGELTYKSRLK